MLERKKASARQRSVAIYLCKTLSGKKNAEIGQMFGITLQGVTNTLRRLGKVVAEDRRLDKESHDKVNGFKAKVYCLGLTPNNFV